MMSSAMLCKYLKCNIIIVLSLSATSMVLSDKFGMPLGCYIDRDSKHDLPVLVKTLNAADSVELCVDACHRRYYRYAGLQNAISCYCGGTYGEYGLGNCDKVCHLNSTQICGGIDSNSIYDTGQRVPSPPTSLTVINTTETSIHIGWTQPLSPNGIITLYEIKAKYVETFSESSILPPLSLTYTNNTSSAKLLNLHPGTKYNVSVAAHSIDGLGVQSSLLIRTKIGEPSEPDVPVVVRRDHGQMVVKLTPTVNENGPVTSYQVVVIGEGGHAAFEPELLYSWMKAQHEGQPYYIAAELSPEAVHEKNEFVVGDGRTYGKYFNAPLPLNHDIHVTVGIVSTLDGITRVRYAHAGHEQHGIVILDVGKRPAMDDGGDTSSLVVILSIAIGVFGFLLILSVIAYFVLRRKLGRRRPVDHQELTLQGPMIQVDNGYIHDGFIPEDEEEERVNHYEKLKHQVWNIPRNFLDVQSGDVLGKGIYGNVVKGTVQQRGFPIPSCIHVINDGQLSATNKRFMLQDLDILIRLGSHMNLVGLIGTCESPDTLFVVLDYHPATLKDILLESRCLEHSGVGVDPSRFCSLSEFHVLESVLSVARALEHLSKAKIVHKQVCARNVLMADGLVPKLTGHGISKYDRRNEVPDPTRWMAHEVFRSRHHVMKSDVWSFGCLLWEATALGGTPYAGVRTTEIGPRVMRGLRLPQLNYIGDDLYQLMLQCWQLDLDERPTFEEIGRILENLVADAMIHVNFSIYDSFHYESYIAEFERKF